MDAVQKVKCSRRRIPVLRLAGSSVGGATVDDVTDLRTHAVPLSGVEPDLPEDDLDPLLDRLASARVIGLGEATHGDHESFAFKVRLIRALVRRGRCDVVIFERGVAEMDAYDRYVTGQTPTVVVDQRLYPWITEEVRDLLDWLHRWNQGGGTVRLAGMDMYNQVALRLAIPLLHDLGAEPPPLWREIQAELQRPFDPATWFPAALDRWDAARPPTLAGDTPTHRWVLLLAASFRQWLAYSALTNDPTAKPWEWRDQALAENTLAQLDRFGPRTKAVLWAHNGHVYHEPPVAGSHLRARLGPAYRSVCCTFGTGAFNAGAGTVNPVTKLPEGSIDWTLRPYAADPPPEDALEWMLGQLDLACFVVEPARVASLLEQRSIRNVGAAVFAGREQFSHRCVPADVYDLLVYFRKVRPSWLLPSP